MNVRLTLAAGLAAIIGAHGARGAAQELGAGDVVEEPFAPSPAAAPFVSLGYRELASDLLVARLMPYFGGRDNTAAGLGALCDAILALDPRLGEMYEWCARAMTLARSGVDQTVRLRAIAMLEAGMREVPDDWRLPYVAGQMYMLDLETQDPAQRRAWDERGSRMIEAAIRKPGAPTNAAITAAHLRTKLGQQQRAIDGLREMLLITNDPVARARLVEKLAELSNADADEIAAEVLDARSRFDAAWKRDRPALSPSLYILLGPRRAPGFDLGDLATGGRDLLDADPDAADAPDDAAPSQ